MKNDPTLAALINQLKELHVQETNLLNQIEARLAREGDGSDDENLAKWDYLLYLFGIIVSTCASTTLSRSSLK